MRNHDWLGCAVTLLLVCTAASAKTVTVTLVGNDAPELRPGTYERTIKAFQAAYPGIKVKFSMYSEGEFVPWLLARAAAGSMPDVFYHRSQYTDLFASKGLIQPLDKYIKKDKLDLSDFWAGQRPECLYGGRMYVLPEGYASWAVAYNVEQVRESGVVISNKPWTWEELRATAQKLTRRDGNKTTRYGFHYGDGGVWGMLGFFYGKSGAIYASDMKACTIGNPENAKLLDMFGQMIAQGIVPAYGWEDFGAKKVTMSYEGSWTTAVWRNRLKGNHFDLTYVPTGEFSERPSVTNTGAGYIISASSKNPQAAWELVKFLTSQQVLDDVYVANLTNLPGRKSSARLFAQKVAASGDPKNVQVWVDSAERGWNLPSTPYHDDLVRALTDRLQSFYKKTKSATWVMQETEKDVNRAIARKPLKRP